MNTERLTTAQGDQLVTAVMQHPAFKEVAQKIWVIGFKAGVDAGLTPECQAFVKAVMDRQAASENE